MKPTNLLFILSDQHTRAVSGCYSHPVVQTPNLDRLAEHGTRFNNAYTNCPICVPARASLATGLYVHQIGNWDNGFPYDGGVPSWGHRLREQGHRVDSIGKLHFRGQGDDNGFSREIDPLHVVEGVGDILGCLRDSPSFRHKRGGIIGAGPGDSTYLRYDVSNADQACRWLTEYGHGGKPWVLFLSFVCPHPP
jgi:choline-sulfatase